MNVLSGRVTYARGSGVAIIGCMGARDWRTVGVDVPAADLPLPRWTFWAVVPVIVPLAAMLYLNRHWSEIPLRFSVGSGRDLLTRTPLHVYAPLIFGAGMAAVLLFTVLVG